MARLPHRQVHVYFTHAGKVSSGSLVLSYWPMRQAWRRAFVCFAAIYSLGGMAQFNPMLHFFLPPLWIIIGPYVAHRIFSAYRQTFELSKGQGSCPACNLTTHVFVYQNEFPCIASCKNCNENLDIRVISASDYLKTKNDLRVEAERSTQKLLNFFPKMLRHPRYLENSWLWIVYLSVALFTLVCSLVFLYFWVAIFRPYL